MPPREDQRWRYILGGLNPDGTPRPMSFDILAGLAMPWAEIVADADDGDGPGSLLRMSRSLFAHAWFDYEFMVIACLIGFQALEASFRELYPDADRQPFGALIERAQKDGALPRNIAELADTARELRNLYSHPQTQSAITVAMAASMLENTHRLVALVLAAVRARTG